MEEWVEEYGKFCLTRMSLLNWWLHCPISVLKTKRGKENNRFYLLHYTKNMKPFHEQENRLQNFKLPEPVLCIGGFLQIELSGRVQRQEMDDLFYIWLVSSASLYSNVVGEVLKYRS